MLIEGIAAKAVTLAEMGASEAEARATLIEDLKRTGAGIDIVRQAARKIRRLPQPVDEPADEAARTEFFREMVGATTPTQELEAQLRAQEWLQRLADDPEAQNG